jgi:hypothetical protein
MRRSLPSGTLSDGTSFHFAWERATQGSHKEVVEHFQLFYQVAQAITSVQNSAISLRQIFLVVLLKIL